jgi:cytochrome c oxidase subunit IV
MATQGNNGHGNTGHGSHGHDDEDHVAHILPLKMYFGVWAALIVLTVVTVGVSYIDFNAILGISNVNLMVAMIVATVKALLVATFFMHLKYDTKINTVTFASSLIFLAIFFLLTFADLMTRGRVEEFQGNFEKVHGLQSAQAPKH